MEYHKKKSNSKTPSPSSQTQYQSQAKDEQTEEDFPKPKENGVENAKKLKEFIENKDIESLSNLLNTENISKRTLNIGLCLALPKYYNNNQNQDIIECLLNRGAEVDSHFRYMEKDKAYSPKIEEKDNVSCLMYACLKVDVVLIDLMCHEKHDVNLKDKFGRNTLFYPLLSENGDNADVINYLLNYPYEVNCKGKIENGKGGFTIHTPLSLAATKNYTECVKALLKYKADPNFKTIPDEDTVLHIAVRNSNVEIVKEILKISNVSLEEKNKEGKTPCDLALNQSQTEIYAIIVKKIKEVDRIKNNNAKELLDEENQEKKIKSENIFRIDNVSNDSSINDNNNDNNNDNENHIENHIENINENNNNENINKIDENINDNNKSNSKNLKKILKNYFNTSPSLLKQKSKKKISSLQIHLKNEKPIPPFSKKIFGTNSFLNINKNFDPILTIDLSSEKITNILSNIKEEKNTLKKQYEFRINEIEENFKKKENEYKNMINNLLNENNNLKKQLESKENNYIELKNEYMKLFDRNIFLEQMKNNNNNNNNENNNNLEKSLNLTNYLNKKFINFQYVNKYLINSLTKDLMDYQIFVSMFIEKNHQIFDILIDNLKQATKESLPDYDVHLYGSHATNLCLPWSDLDVVLISNTNEENNINENNINNNPQILLNHLHENIRNKKWVKESKYISSANIPIIKLVTIDEYGNVPIDISIQDSKHFGLKCVDLVKNFLNQYEHLKPIVLALKNIFKLANYNDPYKGGISSYGLILMIVYYLQKQNKINTNNNNNDLGGLFFDIIYFYAIVFNCKEKIYVKLKDEDEDINNDNNINLNTQLIIIDPLNPNNNVSKSCFQYINVKMTFLLCYKSFKEDCECGCHYTGEGNEYNNLDIPHNFLKRMFSVVNRFSHT